MSLVIKPYQIERLIDRPLACIDDIIYTLAKWKNIECYYMFIDRWNFEILDCSRDILGEIFTSKYSINENYLMNYHGIKIHEKKVKTYLELLRIFEDELLIGNPIMVIFDAYSCPWDQFYEKYHNTHRCIVIGIDFEKEIIIMCDPYNNIEKEEVSFEQYKNGYSEYYYIVEYIDETNCNVTDFDKLNMLKRSLSDKNKMILDIHNYADIFMNNFNPQNELNGADHYFGTPLYTNLNILIWNRWTYALLVKHLSVNNEQLMDAYVDIKNIALLWNNIKLMIAKSFYIENYAQYIKRIAEKIHNVALIEESVYKKLDDIFELKRNGNICKTTQFNVDNSKILPVPLTDFFNNKGICYSNAQKVADFTGAKEYLVFSRRDLQKFKINAGNGFDFDNISCAGQVISLNNIYAKYMIITGCSEWGDYEDLIIINNNRGKKIINISMSDLSHEPRYGEQVLLSGKAYEYTENIVKIKQEHANIFQIKCSIFDEVNSFELPICPNIHIFSINIEL